MGYFEKAIRRDSGYRPAYAAMAAAYDLLGMYEILASDESYSKAQEFANKALRLDETLSEALHVTSSRRVILAFRLDLRRAGLPAGNRTGPEFRSCASLVR
jgi:tetratricopeptide (TPR) repeat protein